MDGKLKSNLEWPYMARNHANKLCRILRTNKFATVDRCELAWVQCIYPVHKGKSSKLTPSAISDTNSKAKAFLDPVNAEKKPLKRG